MKTHEFVSTVQDSARIPDREGRGFSPEQARQHARAVTAALREAVGRSTARCWTRCPATMPT